MNKIRKKLSDLSIKDRDKFKKEVKRLTDSGYRRTSNRFGRISRVDRPDWIEHCEKEGFPKSALVS